MGIELEFAIFLLDFINYIIAIHVGQLKFLFVISDSVKFHTTQLGCWGIGNLVVIY